MVEPTVPKEEQIGFHKGSLTTLAKERQELMRMLGIVEQLMQLHIKGLQELGVDLETQAKDQAKTQATIQNASGKSEKKLEDSLR